MVPVRGHMLKFPAQFLYLFDLVCLAESSGPQQEVATLDEGRLRLLDAVSLRHATPFLWLTLGPLNGGCANLLLPSRLRGPLGVVESPFPPVIPARSTALRATDRRGCGSRGPPSSRVRRGRGSARRAPISRSSRRTA